MVGQHSLPSHTYARIFEVHAAGAEKGKGLAGRIRERLHNLRDYNTWQIEATQNSYRTTC